MSTPGPIGTMLSGQQSGGQPGTDASEQLVAVPASLWSDLIKQISSGGWGGGPGRRPWGTDGGGGGGGVLPFSAVPTGGQGGQGQGEALIAVPAGLWGSLIKVIGQGVGGMVGGKAGQTISGVSGMVGDVLPFSAVPTGGHGGQGQGEPLIAVPAGLWGSLIKVIGRGVGDLVGGEAGQTISGVSGVVGDLLPLSTVPTGGQGGGGQGQGEPLIAVPAGLWGSLIKVIGQGVGGMVGGKAGQTISGVSGMVGDVLPFSTIPATAR